MTKHQMDCHPWVYRLEDGRIGKISGFSKGDNRPLVLFRGISHGLFQDPDKIAVCPFKEWKNNETFKREYQQ
jgi:hypothetical protein